MVTRETAICEHLSNEQIRSHARPSCYVCGSRGERLYSGLSDKLFGAPGTWSVKKCANSNCVTLWLDPMPLEEDIGLAYVTYHTHVSSDGVGNARPAGLFGYVAAGYIARRWPSLGVSSPWGQMVLGAVIYVFPHRRAEIDAQFLCLPEGEGKRLLDVGCGSGKTLDLMSRRGWQCEGIDFDPAAVDRARSQDLPVVQGTLHSQKYAANSFDAVVLSHVIEHVHQPLELLIECYRILKPGGRLIVLTPNCRSMGHRIYGLNWRGLEAPRHLHLFSRNSLRSLAEKAGFARNQHGRGGLTRSILLASHSLKTGSPTPGRAARLLSEILSVAEHIYSCFDYEANEEILQISWK